MIEGFARLYSGDTQVVRLLMPAVDHVGWSDLGPVGIGMVRWSGVTAFGGSAAAAAGSEDGCLGLKPTPNDARGPIGTLEGNDLSGA